MKYNNYLEEVSIEKMFSRAGHKPEKCDCCGQSFTDNEGKIIVTGRCVRVHYEGNGGKGHSNYAHLNCIKPTFYGNEERENIGGTPNTTFEKMPRTSAEIEIFNSIINPSPESHYLSESERCERALRVILKRIKKGDEIIDNPEYDEVFCDLYVKLLHFGTKHNEGALLQDIGLDCSTGVEGHISELSLEGSSKFFQNLTPAQVSIINDVHNGAHIHVATVYTDFYSVFRPVFDVLIKFFDNMPYEDKIKYLGSDFRSYAGAYVGCCDHSAGINTNNIPTAELRIARFNNADQYTRLMKTWRGVVKLFNTYAYKVENGTWTAEHLGKKLVKEFSKIYNPTGIYSKGR